MINNAPQIEPSSTNTQTQGANQQTAVIAKTSQAVKTENTNTEQVVAQTQEAQGVGAERNAIAPEELSQVVENLNAFVQIMKRSVSFEVDKESGRDVISVFDADTQELIRQIPSEEALKLLKRMDEAVGLLFSERV